jgi:inosose dehydratase
MTHYLSRRRFVFGMGAAAIVSAVPSAVGREPLLYPPVNLSYFDTPIGPRAADIRLGCAAITWGGNDAQAIKDVAEVGFRGIQLRSNILAEYGEHPKRLRELLDKHGLQMVALSSGSVRAEAGKEAEEIALHARNAAFVRDVGGRYLQLVDGARPKDRKPEAADFARLGRVMTEIGKRSVDLGIPLGYHNHMDSLGEAPDEVDRVMEAVDRRYVKLELDVAHYFQGGGDPARAILQYRDDLLFLHIKDVESPVPGDTTKRYRFVELGRGRVDLPAVFKALEEVKFRGWAIVELDAVPDNARTPKESALISKRYLAEKLGLKI